jgi:hypothetical protein
LGIFFQKYSKKRLTLQTNNRNCFVIYFYRTKIWIGRLEFLWNKNFDGILTLLSSQQTFHSIFPFLATPIVSKNNLKAQFQAAKISLRLEVPTQSESTSRYISGAAASDISILDTFHMFSTCFIYSFIKTLSSRYRYFVRFSTSAASLLPSPSNPIDWPL